MVVLLWLCIQVSNEPSNDDSDPDYMPNSKRLSGGRKKSNILGKRIKMEADGDCDHVLDGMDGASGENGLLDAGMMSSFRSRSLVWQVFVKEQDGEYTKCTICGTLLKLMSGSTTTMLNHYISKHTDEYQEALTNRVRSVRAHQLSLLTIIIYCCICKSLL